MIVFICGCRLETLLAFGYKITRDESGKLICPSHGVPEYGWRTKEALATGKLPGGKP